MSKNEELEYRGSLDTKSVYIWDKKLCSTAEWEDFLKCVKEKTDENNKLRQQIEELKAENERLQEEHEFVEDLHNYFETETLQELKIAFAENIKSSDIMLEITDKVEQQLTEKDEEIDRLKANIKHLQDDNADLRKGVNSSAMKVVEGIVKQSQNQKAIKVLKQIRNKVNGCFVSQCDYVALDYILDKIERNLKGE